MIPEETSKAQRGDLLALGFGTTVAMWAVGYVGRIPPAIAPNRLLLILMVACLFGGAVLAGQRTRRGWKAGLWTCLIAAGLNLLILGSLLGGDRPNSIVPSAAWWLPGFFLVAAIVGSVGGLIGTQLRSESAPQGNWTGAFAKVLVLATLLLLIIGGIVTGQEAGLAVVDWPNSYGYNMFLYPLSRMTGGIYYEHAHRLFGALVGLTTLALAVHIQRTDERNWVRRLGWVALAMVVVQGVLGGLRVTGRFTMASSPELTAPSITLAMVHGTLGQVFFATCVSLAVFTSSAWRRSMSPTMHSSAGTDRALSIALVLLLMLQIILGAILRHTAYGLWYHISLAVIVVLAAFNCGVRAWGIYADQPVVQRAGKGVIVATGIQLVLGLGAYAVVGATEHVYPRPWIDVVVTTAHQATGAVLLAAAVVLMLWSHRLLEPAPAAELRQAG